MRAWGADASSPALFRVDHLTPCTITVSVLVMADTKNTSAVIRPVTHASHTRKGNLVGTRTMWHYEVNGVRLDSAVSKVLLVAAYPDATVVTN